MISKYALTLAVLLSLAGCAGLESTGHKYLMRGQILETRDSSVYLCIGSHDGAQVGQELEIYKFDKIPGPHKNVTAFKREKTGTVRITEIVNEHYARAKMTSGYAKENYMVELTR